MLKGTITYHLPNGKEKTTLFHGMLSDYAKVQMLKKEGRFIKMLGKETFNSAWNVDIENDPEVKEHFKN